jgi:putative transposase
LNRTHKIALDPTVCQEAYFRRCCGVSRFTYNWALAEWKKQYAAGEKPSGTALKKQFNALRHVDFPWTGEVLRDATAQPFVNVQRSFQNFFENRSKYPRFKKKGIHDSFYCANDKFNIDGNRIQIPRIGWVKMHETLRFEGKILSAVVSRTAHKWFVSIAVDVPRTLTTSENQAVVGVDLGIKSLATLSTGEKFEAPKPLKRSLVRLQRLSRQLSRKPKGSNRRWKAKQKLARLHYRVACVRNDALHKLTTELVARFGTVVIEDLNVRGMLHNRHLSRAISDVGFWEFRRQLEYKMAARGGRLVVADRWYPSSKTCSNCWFKLDILSLGIREWACPVCGVSHDRDINAAINLEKLGAASPEVTPVEKQALARRSMRVKPASVKRELTLLENGSFSKN